MVPLPNTAKGASVEILVALVGTVRLHVGSRIGFQPCAGRASRVSFESKIRPAVNPCDGAEAHGTANAVKVEHRHCPPFAIGQLHHTSLMNVGAGHGILVGWSYLYRVTIVGNASAELGHVSGMVAVSFAGTHHTHLVRTMDVFRAGTGHFTIRHIVGTEDVIHAVHLIYMVSFTHHVALFDNDTLSSFNRTAHIGLQFGTHHGAVAVDGIDFAIIVEKDAQVIDTSLHIVMFPRTADVLAGKALQSLTVHIGVKIESSVVMTDTGRPDTLAIYFLAILQAESRVIERVTVEAVAHIFPVDQVLGVENDEAGHGVHSRTSQIIVIAHTDDIGVGKLIIEQGIGKRTVAVIGSPGFRLCQCRSGSCQCQHRGQKDVFKFHRLFG